MKKFPFVTLHQSLLLLRIFVSIVFLAHSIVRIIGGTIDRFAGYLENKGFIMGLAIVWAITAYEVIGGIAMALGYFTKWVALGFMLLILCGIIIIHAEKGWFVGEHGAGGMEYSVLLIFSLLVIAASDRK